MYLNVLQYIAVYHNVLKCIAECIDLDHLLGSRSGNVRETKAGLKQSVNIKVRHCGLGAFVWTVRS
jgi:hypothetical protein